MIELADDVGCHVIVTTGGTGPAEARCNAGGNGACC